MNVYDFDKTIFPGDSAFRFWLFCVKRHPAVLLELHNAFVPALMKLSGRGSTGELKEAFFSFLKRIPDAEREAELFWDKNIYKIFPSYLVRKATDDVIISASPAFLVGEACRRLGVACIATGTEPSTGRLTTPNCKGEEKLVRYRAEYPDAVVDEFFSDSMSDLPMMLLAKKAYLVKNGAVRRRIDPITISGGEL